VLTTAALAGSWSWTSQVSGTSATLWGADFVDTVHGWAVGKDGVVFVTSNGSFPGPSIMELTPTSGPPGTKVTITGSTFIDVTRVIAFSDTLAQSQSSILARSAPPSRPALRPVR
jgi:hypothetical protein